MNPIICWLRKQQMTAEVMKCVFERLISLTLRTLNELLIAYVFILDPLPFSGMISYSWFLHAQWRWHPWHHTVKNGKSEELGREVCIGDMWANWLPVASTHCASWGCSVWSAFIWPQGAEPPSPLPSSFGQTDRRMGNIFPLHLSTAHSISFILVCCSGQMP